MEWFIENEKFLGIVAPLATPIVGAVGIAFLLWRTVLTDRQVRVASEQTSLIRQNSAFDQYQRALEMLSDENMSVRLGGIYSLKRLASENPRQWHVQSAELLCTFIRHPVDAPKSEHRMREDVQAALDAVVYRSDAQIAVERDVGFAINLFRADLRHAKLSEADLRYADLSGADMRNVEGSLGDFSNTKMGGDLRGSQFHHANFSKAQMNGVDMRGVLCGGAHFVGTNLNHAKMSGSMFQRSIFEDAWGISDVSNSDLTGASMMNATFYMATLLGANLRDTDFSGAKFPSNERGHVRGGRSWSENVYCKITQRQLDEAMADPANPPVIAQGTLDVETSLPIEWDDAKCGNRWIESQREKQRWRSEEKQLIDDAKKLGRVALSVGPYWLAERSNTQFYISKDQKREFEATRRYRLIRKLDAICGERGRNFRQSLTQKLLLRFIQRG